MSTTVAASSSSLGWVVFSTLMSWTWYAISWLLTLSAWLISALLFGVWWCQGLLLYLPHSGTTLKRRALKFNDAGYQSPEEYRLPFEDVYIRVSEHIRVHAWFCPQAPAAVCLCLFFRPADCPPFVRLFSSPHFHSMSCVQRAASAPTVVLFHGNAGNIGYAL